MISPPSTEERTRKNILTVDGLMENRLHRRPLCCWRRRAERCSLEDSCMGRSCGSPGSLAKDGAIKGPSAPAEDFCSLSSPNVSALSSILRATPGENVSLLQRMGFMMSHSSLSSTLGITNCGRVCLAARDSTRPLNLRPGFLTNGEYNYFLLKQSHRSKTHISCDENSFHIRSFHASRRLRTHSRRALCANLPWMSDLVVYLFLALLFYVIYWLSELSANGLWTDFFLGYS